MNKFLDIALEVKKAFLEKKPVVALESTIISHGMPYPKNVQTALAVEQTIRDHGAVPATIAIIGGRLKAGLSPEQLEYFGKKGTAITKVSRRDLATVVARGEDGATTVSATMIIAQMAGIDVFATGGVGGVHRKAELTMDISADLDELARTQVLVVCAGAKAILDLPKTAEYLETKGVATVGYQTSVMPAFYTRASMVPISVRSETAEDIANIWSTQKALGIGGGLLVTNPIPEIYSMDRAYIESKIEEAVNECERLGIKGKDTTPFLLERIQELTGGSSLEANIKLVINNAILACQIAANIKR